MTPAALRPRAEADLIERTRCHRETGGAQLAARFSDAAIAALRTIEESPRSGSPRVGDLIGVQGLRRVGLAGFPCGWLHLERVDRPDVIRLLADRQDLAAALDDPAVG